MKWPWLLYFNMSSDTILLKMEKTSRFTITKAELPQEGILFRTQFPSLGIFIKKKVGFQKNQGHQVYNF
jgi:hypothetical protein